MSSKGLVLVTGANGFVAGRTVAHFLQAGYAVRGTVRSRKSADGLVAALSDYIKNRLLKIVEVPDITVSGAFDSALEGVTDVAHLATPVSVTNTDVVGIRLAALQGTLSILDSTLRHAGIKSFVFMSPLAAVISYSQPRTYTEADWHDESVEIVDKQGAAAGGLMVYTASKVKAERVFWSWIESNKPSFRAVALCPVYIAGPPLFLPKSPEKIATTNAFVWQVFSGQDYPAGPTVYGHHVDVREVARLQVFVVENPEVLNGQRIIVGGRTAFGVPQTVADILREAYPDRKHIIKEGTHSGKRLFSHG
ncbi:putative NAD-dependent epimerase/dehydratase domain-containing protein [Seiridium unicorne]|uniref:NAD-dependent epimerase/dehydratase domain-containing protein n=1 Tax=Seiridium unicorne TaxID=138068 RepID=A0ABR2URX4_9PEZI